MNGLWGFLALALVLSLTPGPDDVLVLGCSLRGGPRSGAAATLGVAAGSLVWGVTAATGLAAVVARSPAMYDGMRWAGAGYLVALGALPLLAHRLTPRRRPVPAATGRHAARSGDPNGTRRAFAAGLLSDLLNPKIGVFYLMAVPQFIDVGEPVMQYSLLLCAIDVAVATSWLLGLTWLAHSAVTWFRRPGVALWSQRAFSAALIGMGAAAGLGA